MYHNHLYMFYSNKLLYSDKNFIMKTEIRVIRVLLAACAVLQLVFFVLGWSGVLPLGFFMQISPDGMSAAAARALAPAHRLAGVLAGLPVLLTLGYGLWRLLRALANIERRALFDLDTIAHVRAFAGAALASTCLAIVEAPVRTLAFRLIGNAPENRVSIGVTSTELLLILVCALFYLIIRLMHEGRRLAEDNEGFV